MERPGATGDPGGFADRIELQNVRAQARYPILPDTYQPRQRLAGYFEVAGILGTNNWDDMHDAFELPATDAMGREPDLKPEWGRATTFRLQ